jgi:nitrite reductase/ring-hydroxylating ferredoxin subunit
MGSMPPAILAIPDGLAVPGSDQWPFVVIAQADDVAPGTLQRLTRDELDLLLAYTSHGLCLIDDRCPHMAAPLSIGTLDGCIVACPLHRGRFDLATGAVEQFPTTGGLTAEGRYCPPWQAPGSPSREEPTDIKARARALTRVRRVRYYPLRIRDGMLEARLPL